MDLKQLQNCQTLKYSGRCSQSIVIKTCNVQIDFNNVLVSFSELLCGCVRMDEELATIFRLTASHRRPPSWL